MGNFVSPSTRRIGTFASKALAIYLVWYVVYDLWLLPNGQLDRWLSHNVAWMTDAFLSFVGIGVVSQGRYVLMEGIPGIVVADGCNGLTTVGLFIGFVVAYPGQWKRRLWFIPLGILAIYATNVFRVVAMLLAQMYWPAAFEPLHGFGLTAIFYVVVFALWVVWVNHSGADVSLPHATPLDPSTAS